MPSDSDREALLQIIERRTDIASRFTNLERIGSAGGDGHFSLLVKADDSVSQKQVALKFYNPFKRLDPDASYRFGCFSREAQILEKLNGERDFIGWISPVSEFTERFTAGTVSLNFPFAYYALELAETDVGTLVAEGHLGPEQMLEVFHMMCRAVRRLHELGLTHRDLKPPNFLLTSSGQIKLSDFGTARYLDGTAAPLSPSYILPPGDLRYAAPETLACLLDDDPSVAAYADVFALGAILFEMATGTILGLHLLDQQFRQDLTKAMSVVARGSRKKVFQAFVGEMADKHPLPHLAAFRPDIPRCILPLIDDLYKSMAHLDYRRRLIDFRRIILRLQGCLLVLRNEEKYKRWQEQKQRYRIGRSQKLERRVARALSKSRTE
jgi:serine/threonine protein kinase